MLLSELFIPFRKHRQKPLVVITYDQRGRAMVQFSGDVYVFSVDERVRNDRVYRHTVEQEPSTLWKHVGPSEYWGDADHFPATRRR